MSKRRANARHDKRAVKRQSSRIMIAGLGAAIAVSAAFVILASMRSGSEDQSGVPAVDTPAATVGEQARRVAYDVVNSYPHDPTSFTQGLLYHDGGFYESTGQYGSSKLRRLEFPTGRVLKEISLPPELFGEGLARVGNRLIQVTWKSHRGFVYDLDTFRLLQEFSYDSEGWGLAYDGKYLILSDGSSDLFYLDPETFKTAKKLPVRMNGQPISELNELEFIDGEIWANVWQTDLILRIDPSTGGVTSFLDLKGILAPSDKTGGEDVLNGIAYDAQQRRIFVTGKLWPRLFEIKLKS